MASPKQLPLTASVKALFATQGEKLLAVTRDAILSEVKLADDFAELVDVVPSQLSSALKGNGYAFNLKWLPAALYVDKRRRILSHQAALVDCRVVEAELTDADYRKGMEAALRRAGPAGEAIRRDAFNEESP